ncbi:hypothetical protein ABVK25_000196 [Lepraria finkii]|uniref:Uncharacterized protein n=1 Tax=Lepraria finkii TaxID=1340010 RepID=A0ABR4BM75_9LECA
MVHVEHENGICGERVDISNAPNKEVSEIDRGGSSTKPEQRQHFSSLTLYSICCTILASNGSFPVRGNFCASDALDQRLRPGLLHQPRRQKLILGGGSGIKAL